jgi:hypothetical protein
LSILNPKTWNSNAESKSRIFLSVMLALRKFWISVFCWIRSLSLYVFVIHKYMSKTNLRPGAVLLSGVTSVKSLLWAFDVVGKRSHISRWLQKNVIHTSCNWERPKCWRSSWEQNLPQTQWRSSF